MDSPADVNEQSPGVPGTGTSGSTGTPGHRVRRGWRCTRSTRIASSAWRGATCGCTSRAWAPTTSTHAVPVIVRGEGCYVYDEHGKRYLDAPLRAVLRERRPRPQRARARRPRRRCASSASTRTGATRTRPRSSSRRASRELAPGQPQPRVLHLRRLGGGRVGVEAREGLPPRHAASTTRHKLISRKLAYHGTSMGALTATGAAAAARRRSNR